MLVFFFITSGAIAILKIHPVIFNRFRFEFRSYALIDLGNNGLVSIKPQVDALTNRESLSPT